MRDMTDEERATLFPIILNEYNPTWPQWYADEKARLLLLVGIANITRISHIGSTAVPGLTAKPTIDILLELAETTDIEHLPAVLPEDEYICLRQQTIPTLDEIMFLKGYTPTGFAERVYHIHVRYPGDWNELYFRDYLLEHPETARAYGLLKYALKEKFEHNRDEYTNAKGAFINSITKKAKDIIASRNEVK